jgi:hypothetical protein
VYLHAPGTAKLDSRITVRASGLKKAHYTLVLSRVAAYATCLASIAAGNSKGGSLMVSGVLPTRLACHLGRNTTFGSVAVTTGTYWLSLGELVPPTGFAATASFAKTRIKLVS